MKKINSSIQPKEFESYKNFRSYTSFKNEMYIYIENTKNNQPDFDQIYHFFNDISLIYVEIYKED